MGGLQRLRPGLIGPEPKRVGFHEPYLLILPRHGESVLLA